MCKYYYESWEYKRIMKESRNESKLDQLAAVVTEVAKAEEQQQESHVYRDILEIENSKEPAYEQDRKSNSFLITSNEMLEDGNDITHEIENSDNGKSIFHRKHINPNPADGSLRHLSPSLKEAFLLAKQRSDQNK